MRSFRRFASDRKIFLLRLLAVCIPLVLVLALLCQVVFATTYIITDGARVFTHTTFATDPAVVLNQAGVNLGDADTFTARVEADAASITVCRGQAITVRYHGQEQRVSSAGETVGALLSRLDLTIGESDCLSQSPDTLTWDGMVLNIDRIITETQTYAVTVPHETIRCAASSLPKGTEKVLVTGSDGELLRTADVTYVNGAEQKRIILSESMTVPPTTEIIAMGTAPAPEQPDTPMIGDGIITLPTGELLTYYDTAQVRATAYTHTDAGCSMLTYTGTTVHVGTVAVDPRYIPYGTRMFIIASDGSYVYGVAEAEDCGGDIKGDRVDLYLPTFAECIQFGRRECTVYFLG